MTTRAFKKEQAMAILTQSNVSLPMGYRAIISLCVLTPALWLGCCCSLVQADLIGEAGIVARSTGSLGGNPNRVAGWQFVANEDIQVTALGMLDLVGAGIGSGAAAGFSIDHSVALWDTLGNQLAETVIPAGTTAEIGPGTFTHPSTVTGDYRYIQLPAPIALTKGSSYVVSAHFPNVNDFFAQPNGSASLNNLISYSGWRFLDGQATHSFPSSYFSGGAPFTGANLLMTQAAVPEPSGMGLLALLSPFILLRQSRC